MIPRHRNKNAFEVNCLIKDEKFFFYIYSLPEYRSMTVPTRAPTSTIRLTSMPV